METMQTLSASRSSVHCAPQLGVRREVHGRCFATCNALKRFGAQPELSGDTSPLALVLRQPTPKNFHFCHETHSR